MELIDSEMAGSIGLKLAGMIKGMQENIFAKEYFLDPSTFTGVRSVGHSCLFKAVGMI